MTSPNGAQSNEAVTNEHVFQNYAAFGQQLSAILTLLSGIPLQPMLVANKRHQTVSILTLPAGVDINQAAQAKQALMNDEKVLIAAIHLIRTLVAVKGG